MFKGKTSVRDDSLKLPPKDMAWWQDAKFGMFIHWGLYAIPARGEWVMHNEKIPAAEYARLADEFVPKHFDADTWGLISLHDFPDMLGIERLFDIYVPLLWPIRPCNDG
jgi:hypothetical protein